MVKGLKIRKILSKKRPAKTVHTGTMTLCSREQLKTIISHCDLLIKFGRKQTMDYRKQTMEYEKLISINELVN